MSSETVRHTCVKHVGDLTGERIPPQFSYEGGGLSVSNHPDAWETIARSVSGTTYSLTNPDAEFYDADPSGASKTVMEWAVEHDYTKWETVYKGVWYDITTDETRFVLSTDRETAVTEAQLDVMEETDERYVEEVDGLVLGEKGREYWQNTFSSSPDIAEPLMVKSLTSVWYAKANGFDGVWWDEEYAPLKGSAPRGVIFQSKLSNWNITKEPQRITA